MACLRKRLYVWQQCNFWLLFNVFERWSLWYNKKQLKRQNSWNVARISICWLPFLMRLMTRLCPATNSGLAPPLSVLQRSANHTKQIVWLVRAMNNCVEIGNMPELVCVPHDSPVIKRCWYVAMCWRSLLVIDRQCRCVTMETASPPPSQPVMVACVPEQLLTPTPTLTPSSTQRAESSIHPLISYCSPAYCVGSTPINPLILLLFSSLLFKFTGFIYYSRYKYACF